MHDPQMWPISVDSPVPEIPLEEDRLLEIVRPISAVDSVDTAIGKEVSEDHQDSTMGMFQPEPMYELDPVRAFCHGPTHSDTGK